MTKARDIASAIPAPSTVSSAELGFLDGVTSAVQTQIDTKAASSTAATLTGTQTLTNKTLTTPVLTTPSISTITTKGDLLGFDTALNRVPIGANNTVLTADSAQALGLKWATPAASSRAITLVSTTTMSGATHTVSGLSGDTFSYQIIDAKNSTANAQITLIINGDTSANYAYSSFSAYSYSTYVSNYMDNQAGTTGSFGNFFLGLYTSSTSSKYSGYGTITGGTSSSGIKLINAAGNPDTTGSGTNGKTVWTQGSYTSASAITSISFKVNAGAFNAGTLLIYQG